MAENSRYKQTNMAQSTWQEYTCIQYFQRSATPPSTFYIILNFQNLVYPVLDHRLKGIKQEKKLRDLLDFSDEKPV